jgi:hypothetical protein
VQVLAVLPSTSISGCCLLWAVLLVPFLQLCLSK